jgi:ABC-2 type transport system permease protein
MSHAPADLPRPSDPGTSLEKTVELRHRLNLSGLGTLFRLTLQQHTRGKRLWVLSGLYLLAVATAVIARLVDRPPPLQLLEIIVVFILLPQAMLPLTALLYSSGMIRDEIEEQTLTYLLIRPLPRWAVYVTKLLATMLISIALAAVFTVVTYLALYVGSADFSAGFLAGRVARTVLLMSLALCAYCAVFGCISLLTNRSLVVGVGYIIIFEGWLANIDFAARRFTIMYYFRTLSVGWLNLRFADWNLADPPSAGVCLMILAIIVIVAAGLAATLFAGREFRVKTPGGS